MSKQTNNVTTETRDLRNQPSGGASGTSGLKVGKNLKATVASGSSLKSQGEAMTTTTGNNKVFYLIVSFCISMELGSILFFTEITKEFLENNQYHSSNILNQILMYYYLTITYLTCTLSVFKTIKTEIWLCSIGPDITLLINYGPNIFLYDYPIIVKRLLINNVPNQNQSNCFYLYPNETTKCCQTLCSKSITGSLTTYVPSVYSTRTFTITKKYLTILVTKQYYVKKYVILLVKIFFLKKCNKLISIQFQGAKRKGQNIEEPKAIRRRAAMKDLGMSYAELSKTHTMLEARSTDPERALDQEDFEHLDCTIIYLHLDNKPTHKFGIVKMGLSQGGVWMACKDEETVEFVTEQVPKIKPPESKTTENEYRYNVYGPNNRPYKYYKLRVPERFWNTRERFIDLIKHFNTDLDYSYLSGDFYKNAHLRVSSGLVDRAKEVTQAYFYVSLEVEENMVSRLAAKGGIIMIGPNALEILGGGIEKAIEEHEKKQTEQTEDMELTEGESVLNYSA